MLNKRLGLLSHITSDLWLRSQLKWWTSVLIIQEPLVLSWHQTDAVSPDVCVHTKQQEQSEGMPALTQPVTLEIHWNKWYLHEILNDPSNTLGHEFCKEPCLPVTRLAVHAGWDTIGGTHLHLPLGHQLLSGPLANVIRVTSLEGNSGHGPLTKADLPTNSPSLPASTSLFKV